MTKLILTLAPTGCGGASGIAVAIDDAAQVVGESLVENECANMNNVVDIF